MSENSKRAGAEPTGAVTGEASDNPISREKLLDRIRKLYAMSRESESSPHEAEIAMRRCQSLMSRFGITESDLKTSEFGKSRIEKTFRAVPSYIGVLGSAVALLHDCICVRGDTIEFRGFSIDAEVASLTFEYLFVTMERTLKTHKREGTIEPGRSASFDFRVGFAMAVLKRVSQIDAERHSHEEALRSTKDTSETGAGQDLIVRKLEVVRSSCMEGLMTRKPTRVRYRDGQAHTAGSNEGTRVSLSRQLHNADTKTIEH